MDLLAAIRDLTFAGTPEKMRALLDLAGDAIEANGLERERMRTAGKRALDHYDMRADLYTNDADAAAGMADILRQAFAEQSQTDSEDTRLNRHRRQR